MARQDRRRAHVGLGAAHRGEAELEHQQLLRHQAPAPGAGLGRACGGSGRPRGRRRPRRARRSRIQAGIRSGRGAGPRAARGRPSRGCGAPAASRWPGRRARGPGCGGPPTPPRRSPRGLHGDLAPRVAADPPRRSSSSPGESTRARWSWLNHVRRSGRWSSWIRARTRRRLRRRVGRTAMSSRTHADRHLLPGREARRGGGRPRRTPRRGPGGAPAGRRRCGCRARRRSARAWGPRRGGR